MNDKVTAVIILVALIAIGVYMLVEGQTLRGELQILHDRFDTFAMNSAGQTVPPVPVEEGA